MLGLVESLSPAPASRPLTAGSGEALAAAQDEKLALVVVEVRLEAVSAYEVCRRLREDHGEA